jgi:hypothetical protein
MPANNNGNNIDSISAYINGVQINKDTTNNLFDNLNKFYNKNLKNK